jgi:hypothetical protein
MRDAVDVILRDGSTMRLRPPVGDDAAAIVAFFAGLSVHSRFLRFHGLAAAGERFARTLVEPDWEEKGSFVGVMGEADEERIVAVGNYVRLRERPRRRSPSPTTTSASASAPACSSNSPPGPPSTGSTPSSPRCCPRTQPC